MQEKKPISVDFSGGMYMDGHSTVQPKETYPIAVGMINRDHNQRQFLSNEHSNEKLLELSTKIAGKIHQEELNRTIYLLRDQSIVIQNHLLDSEGNENLEEVCMASDFGCDWNIPDCERVDITVYTRNCDTYIQWSSDWEYYIVNITQMLDPVRKASLISEINDPDCGCKKTCEYFRVFKSKCTPTVKVTPHQSGGSKKSGAYWYTIRQLNSDGSRTNWSIMQGPSYIYSENNIPGQPARGKTSVEFSDLDCNYEQIEIGYVYADDTGTYSYIVPARYHSGLKYTYNHVQTEEGDPVTLFDITALETVNLQGKHQVNYLDKMYYYGIRPQKEFNIQSVADNVEIRFFAEKYTLEHAKQYQVKSLPRGEAIACGIWINHEDGTQSAAGHISCTPVNGSSVITNSFNNSLSVNPTPADTGSDTENVFYANGNVSVKQQQELKRSRDPADRENSTSAPDNEDELLDIEKALTDSYTTEIQDLVDAFEPAEDPDALVGTGLGLGTKDPAECCDSPVDEDSQFMESKKQKKDAAILDKDLSTAEEIGAKWGNLLENLIGSAAKKDLIKDFTITNIKDVASSILTAVKRREDIYYKGVKYSITKNVSYGSGATTENEETPTDDPGTAESGTILGNLPGVNTGTETNNTGNTGGGEYNPVLPNTVKDTETPTISGGFTENDVVDISYNTPTPGATGSSSVTYPGGEFVGYYAPWCKTEENTKYPCTKDCEGNSIYGRAGENVRHPRVPAESLIPFYESKSVGVPSKATPDADEYADGYVVVVGAEFNNININADAYFAQTGKRVCSINPYEIGIVKLDDSNKTVLTKSLFFQGFNSQNQGKDYIYQKLGGNSFERCDKYISIGEDDLHMHPEASEANSLFGYSLDQSAIEPFIGDATELKLYGRMSGIGYRHNLQSKGVKPTNELNGRREDITGATQSINLSSYQGNFYGANVTGAKYVTANSVHSPPAGGSTPLMNKHQQACLWLQLDSAPPIINDKSFVGDGLDHAVPITQAEAQYGVLLRELPDQYGPVENLAYISKLQGSGSSVRGLIGNRFVSPYSFVKTSYVSDKVGNKFNISQLEPSKSDRCICDDPEDSINFGKFIWTQPAKDGDQADAKNWANLHTPSGGPTRKWVEANEQTATESDYYYWGTATTMFTYWGEWETNPWGVEISNDLDKQRYNFIKPVFDLGSQITDTASDHTKGYLDQHKVVREQPSVAQKIAKQLILSVLPILMSILKIEDLFSPESIEESIGDVASIPFYIAIMSVYWKVIFTNTFVDELLKIPICRTDDEGGIDFTLDRWFTNWNQFSGVFNKEQEFKLVPAFREQSNCCNLQTPLNRIYTSSPIIENSKYNGYANVRVNNYADVSQDKGALSRILELNGKLFGFTTDGVYSLSIPRIEIPTDTFTITAGTGRGIQPVLIIGSNPEGHAGVKHWTHIDLFSIGATLLDYDAGIMYLFTGQEMKPISMSGAYNFFKDHTQYCSTGDCDNIMQLNSFAFGYDPRLQRLLITKKGNTDDESWTISYDPISENGKWISFHKYYPSEYLTTRDKIYHIDMSTGIYEHTSKDGSTYGNFFDSNGNESYVDVKHVGNYMQYASHVLDTRVEDLENNLLNMDMTVDKVALWNSRQTGGEHLLNAGTVAQERPILEKLKDEYGTISATKKRNTWRFHDFHDYTEDINAPMTEKSGECSVEYMPTNYTSDTDALLSQNAKQRNLVDNWFITRLSILNDNKLKYYLRKMDILQNEASNGE